MARPCLTHGAKDLVEHDPVQVRIGEQIRRVNIEQPVLVFLLADAWHDVVVLKFVHTRFVLDRPDLTIYQRGQARVLETLVDGFHSWMNDPDDVLRAPRRLIDSVESTTQAYVELKASGIPEVEGWTSGDVLRLGRSRAVIDYIASFTDAQAIAAAALLSGNSDRHWNDGRSL